MDKGKVIAWDISDLYQGEDDPALGEDLHRVHNMGLKFVFSYKGKIKEGNVDSKAILSGLREYESILEAATVPYLYAYLYYSADTEDERGKSLWHEVRQKVNTIFQMLAFFKPNLAALPSEFLAELAASKELADYNRFLSGIIKWKPHILSEAEEIIIEMKDMTGKATLVSNLDELLGTMSVPIEIEGKRKIFNPEQCLSHLFSPNRQLRERAFSTFLEELGKYGGIIANTLNAIILDHRLISEKRLFAYPMERMNFVNDLDEGIVERMMESVEDHYPLARRYFRLKKCILGTKELKNVDLFAPVDKKKFEISFENAARLLKAAARDLHPLYYSIVSEMFEKKRVDAEIRKGKKYGAFCKGEVPSKAQYISMNYAGTMRDLTTLAHELGHSVNYGLSCKQNYLNFRAPPILEETASAFFEMAATRFLAREEELKDDLPSILASNIEGIITGVFRQNVLTRFEQDIHRVGKSRALGKEEICRLWWNENYRLFNDEVEMIPTYRWGWAYIPHFFHNPFYCYSYIFGNLTSMVLLQEYAEKGKTFLEKIIELFSSGNSRPPLEVLGSMGLSPKDKSFWDRSFVYLDELIGSFEISLENQGVFGPFP